MQQNKMKKLAEKIALGNATAEDKSFFLEDLNKLLLEIKNDMRAN